MNIINNDNVNHIIKYDDITNLNKALNLINYIFPIICKMQILIRNSNNNLLNDDEGLPIYFEIKIIKVIKLIKKTNIPKEYFKNYIDYNFYDQELLSDYIEAYWSN
jgi:hypothetical protein